MNYKGGTTKKKYVIMFYWALIRKQIEKKNYNVYY